MADKFENLERISRLLDEGRITEEEYQALKAELLAAPSGSFPRVEPNRVASEAAPTTSARHLWFAIGWGIGGFIIGVLVNGGIEAASIGLSGEWQSDYRSTWMWSVFPYAFAFLSMGVGLVVADPARPRSRTRWQAVGVASLAVIALALVALVEADNARGEFFADVEPLSDTENRWCESHPDSAYRQLIEQQDLVWEAWDEAASTPQLEIRRNAFYAIAQRPYTDENRDVIIRAMESNVPAVYAILCRSALLAEG